MSFFFFAGPATRASTEPVRWQGAFVFWQRAACGPGENCELPHVFSPKLPVDLQFTPPQMPGGHAVVRQAFTWSTWRLDLLLVWVNPAAGSKDPAYLITQTRLSEATLGVLAECSRYDGVDEIHFLLPGSCSGRSGSTMYGYSALSPAAAGGIKTP